MRRGQEIRKKDQSAPEALQNEIHQLRSRLDDALDALRAIRDGEVDALVHSGQIYTLDTAASDNNRFRGQVLAQINEAIVALDNDHRITYINPAAEEQYGISASAVLGLPLSTLYTYRWLSPEDGKAALKAVEEHDHWRGENIHVRKDGIEMQVESSISRLRDGEGRSIGLLAVIRDVTQRARSQSALEESGRQKDHFLATLAHELRNPLSPLMNGLYLMEKGVAEPEQLENTRNMMLRQLQHMVRLVDDLMDLSRISRGKLELRLEQVDLTNVISMALEASRPLIDKHKHHIKVHIAPGSYLVHGDANRLMQVVSNLLNNSAKYTHPGGRIELRLEKNDENAVICVKDNGVGIDKEAFEKVFDMFAQVDNDQTARTSGLGIGLNIARRLVHMHNGDISVHSDGPGKGCEFSVKIPLLMDQRLAGRNHVSAKHGPTLSKKILVVDDNQDAAETLAMVLTATGHEVKVAHDGIRALEVGRELAPDVIFMDIGMPIMDGREACQRMRKEKWGARIKIIALSGWGQDNDRQRSVEAGFDQHLVKPIERITLQRIISDLPN